MSRKIALLLALAMIVVAFAAMPAQGRAAAQPVVTINTIYPGDEPAGAAPVLAAVNAKMGQEAGVNLALTWAPWDQYYNKVQLAVAAGEAIDWYWGGSSSLAAYYAAKTVAPLDDLLAQYGGPITANIPADRFAGLKIDGVLYAIPDAGNSPITNVYHSALYREDLRVKYNLPALTSLDNIELYLKTIKENEPTVTPLVSTSFAYSMEFLFGHEEYLGGTSGACAYRYNDDGTVTVMAIQDAGSFKGATQKMRDWYNAGYVPKDVLNIGDVTAQLTSGAAAMTSGSAMSASEQQATIAANIPGAILQDAPFNGDRPKYLGGTGGNAFFLSPTSKNPDAVMKFWAWVFTSQENYDLYCYGIKDTNYSLDANGRITFLNSDYASFPSWMFKNLNFLRFNSSLSDDYISTLKHWDDGAIHDPLNGFVFDPTNIATELAQCSSVFSSYSPALDSGAGDLTTLLPEFAGKMKDAGQDAIVAEAQKQIDAYLAANK